jgi:hypothetical protein
MDIYIHIPKYIQKELEKASEHVLKSHNCVKKFEQWVKDNTNEYFEMCVLSGCASDAEGISWEDQKYQTEALTEIEYGNEVDIDALERAINYFKDKF